MWGRRLQLLDGVKVGIAWQAEQGTSYGRRRSIPLEVFALLARIPEIRLVSLQYGCERRPEFPLMTLTGLDSGCDGFVDTASVIPHLKLVVSCDTSIAHLAGALGAPVWVALPVVPDWRWMLYREDSPWYPTMRLFRQQQPGDWGSVFRHMADELRKVIS
jgi:hypothetical protein